MFRTLTLICVIALIVLIAIYHGVFGSRQTLVRPASRCRFPLLDRMTATATWLVFALLAATGFGGLLLLGKHLTGPTLLLHVSAGGAYAVLLALFTMLRAERCGLEKPSWLCQPPRPPAHFSKAQKTCFWLLVLSGLVLMVTAAVQMLPIGDSEKQQQLAEIHRYAALVALLVGVLSLYQALARPRSAEGSSR